MIRQPVRAAGEAPPAAALPTAAPPSHPVEVFLQPGEYFVGDASHRIRTLLGSCVSVTLWCPLLRVGAMSHFLLATRARHGTRRDGRYGDEALSLMLEELAARGVAAAQCQAKIFGGGDMFPAHGAAGRVAIGRHNGEAARQLLQKQGIAVVSESLFGDGHRKIMFDVASGHVWSRQMPLPHAQRRSIHPKAKP
jgi:chemotaxis protein CheD